MGGENKAMQPLAGKALLGHVIERMQSQCENLFLSVDEHSNRWENFGLPQIADVQAGSHGPLGGLLAVMDHIRERSGWLLLVPCDAPFLPLDLAHGLGQLATRMESATALVSYQGQWQPTFSLWHTGVLPDLRKAVLEQGQSGLKEFLLGQSPAVLDWPEQQPSPFFNINSPEDLLEASTWFKA